MQMKHCYEFGPFRLDVAERVLLRGGLPVPLTQKAFETLYVKVERLRQEAAAFTARSRDERALRPEEQANLRRLQIQIQAITGAE